MPEYLSPGVYAEETSYRAKSIEGASTSTAGFIGPTRLGPLAGRPEVLTSFAAFQATYGGLEDLAFGPNYVAHAARAFFEEGGARLYVMRVAGAGRASAVLTVNGITVTARDAGAAGNAQVTFTLTVGANMLVSATVNGVTSFGLTRLRTLDSVVVLAKATYSVRTAKRDLAGVWTLVGAVGTSLTLGEVQAVYPLTVRIDIARPTIDSRGLPTFSAPVSFPTMSLDPTVADGMWQIFAASSSASAPPPLIITAAAPIGVDTLTSALFPMPSLLEEPPHWLAAPSLVTAPLAPAPKPVVLGNGADGAMPTALAYAGDTDQVTGFAAFAMIEDISIVAAPGSTELAEAGAIRQQVLVHCEALRYRVAVLDTPRARTVNGALDWRNQTSSTRAALYYPWVTLPDPFVGGDLQLPPSGFVAGIWARNDNNHAVFKSPANEVILSANDLERRLTKGQQDVLNPEGVNCLRFFEGRGNLVWGARTMSDDPEWKYLSVRRYFCYVEASIERSTNWIVFESNGEALWANVRRTIEDFLLAEWKSGALLGTDPKQAFFVRCDRSTMTQNDLDNGRLVCLIGLAVVKPAEFVIFRIGQWTGSST